MISMFIHAQKVKEVNGETLVSPVKEEADSKLDVNKYFVPTSLI